MVEMPERKIIEEYVGRPIEEVPEEYREKIARLRELGQLGTKKDDQIKTRMKKRLVSMLEITKRQERNLIESKKLT